jgi:CMP-N,N'-diacetyllegionaminic acid synthase
MKRLLAVIPARGGSKGLPKKNILQVKNIPLIAWTIIAAQKSQFIDRLVVSSDDDDIIDTAINWKCEVPFRRPIELSTDTSSSIEVVLHAVEQLAGYEYVAILQPTSPLRTGGDIDEAFSMLLESGAPSCVSICESKESPYLMHALNVNGRINSLLDPLYGVTRRQDLPKSYVLNGAIYIARVDWLIEFRTFVTTETLGYIMPVERSIDIDDEIDLEQFRLLVE